MSAGTSDLRRETVKTKVASEALTEQAAQFITEGGRCASHLLFCEFIDNSLHAMAQRRADQNPKAIRKLSTKGKSRHFAT